MTDAALRIDAVEKSFGPLRVLDQVTFAVAPGECVALCGENGAGKSTLLRILMGLETKDAGAIHAPSGIGMVHQHFSLVPAATVAENVWLGAEPRTRFGFLDRKRAEADTVRMAKDLGWDIDPKARVETLAVGQRQRVEVLKALRTGTKLLLLDEPTAVLTSHEVQSFLELVAALAERGTAIVFVSHKLHEVQKLCRRALVLRKGRIVAEEPTERLDKIAHAMIGGLSTELPARTSAARQDVAMRVESIGARHGASVLEEASFELCAGQVLGVGGVDGNGQEALFAALSGLALLSRGSITALGAQAFHQTSIAARRALGLRAVPSDRHRDALLPGRSLADNLVLGHERLFGQAPSSFLSVLEGWDVRPREPERDISSLSGGNQQKVCIGRELEDMASVKLLLLHEPTRGVDFAARDRIWAAVRRTAASGAAVVVLSSDLDELRALSDALAILYRGKLSAPRATEKLADASLGRLMAGIEQ